MPAKKKFPLLCVTSCLVLLFTASPNLVLGQQAALEEVIVTAQKREQDINDVGITVNAFSAAQLDNYGVRSAEDLEALTPGMTITNSQPSGVPIYTIRGVGFAEFTTTASSTVGLYFDEVSIPYSVMSRGALFDMERIEVLKGPQGDLYGRNTTAGQINFITRKPTTEPEAGIKLGYSRFDVIDAEGFISGPLTDSVQARLAVKTTQSAGDGWQKSLSRPGDALGEKDDVAVRGLVNVDMNDDASLLLNIHYFRDESENMAATAFDGLTLGFPSSLNIGPLSQTNLITADGSAPPQTLPAAPGLEFLPPVTIIFSEDDSRAADWGENYRPGRDNTLKGLSAKLDWDFGNINLTSITAYDHFDRTERYDSSGVDFEDAYSENNTDVKVFTQEIRISSSSIPKLYWLAGMFYSDDRIDESYLLNMSESVYLIDIDTRYEQETTSIAVFGHLEYEFVENARLILGGRYTDEEREWSGCTYDTGDGGLALGLWPFLVPAFTFAGFPAPDPIGPGDCAVYNDVPGTPNYGQLTIFSDEISTDRWMWKVTLDYSPLDGTLFYGTVSRGFKSGGFNGAAALTHSQLQPYGPETLTAYELGVKTSLLQGRLQFNAAGFYYDYKDKQEPSPAVTAVGNIVGLTNVPESEVIGAEIEAHWLLTEGLTLDLGVAYLDTEVKEFEAIDGILSAFPTVITFDASGFELANSPNWQANGTLTYQWPVSGTLSMMVAGDFSYKDDNDGTVDQMPISDYFLVNARAGVMANDGKWSVTVWGRNVFDEEYWHSTSTSNCCFVRLNGMPATYGVSLDYNF